MPVPTFRTVRFAVVVVVAAGCLSLILATPARATVVINWALVGDPGNAADSAAHSGNPAGQGAVAGTFQISRHEVSNVQYVEFLNAKDPSGANALSLYSAGMTSNANGGIDHTPGAANGSKYTIKAGRGNNPVIFVNWYDSIRFANWLHNGQGAGDTETGAYTLLGGTATPGNGLTITRNANATIFLPSEDEWYKAAYYKGGGTNAGYWLYATKSDITPTSDQPPGATPANSINYFFNDGAGNGINDGCAVTGSTTFSTSENYLTDAGAYTGSVGPYGTFDQSGNVYEWNETLIGSARGNRGGSWGHVIDFQRSTDRQSADADVTGAHSLGFRVASLVPEPGTLCLLAMGGPALLRRGRRARPER